ncbi:MAG: NIPSNAP family protein [Candidatus Dormibacteria bacterium]
MIYQLRDYRIRPGAMAEWVAEWQVAIRPLRTKFGFNIVGAWIIVEEDRFIWVLAWEGPGEFEQADRAYYTSADRRKLEPDPVRHIVSADTRMVQSASDPSQ